MASSQPHPRTASWAALLGGALLAAPFALLPVACEQDRGTLGRDADLPGRSASSETTGSGEAGPPGDSGLAALGLSVDARPESHLEMQEDMRAVRHPSDGGGRAWLESVTPLPRRPVLPPLAPLPATLRAAGRARFELLYEAGPLGVAEGGLVLLQVSPFWGWDTPQTRSAVGPGYTEVSSDAEGVSLEVMTLAEQLLGIRIGGRALLEGERIRVVYGSGPRGARIDSYAEREERIWFAVDGDGDGVRALVADSPRVDIAPGRARRLVLTAPTTASIGTPVSVTLAVLDGSGSAGTDFSGSIRLDPLAGLELPVAVRFEAADRGVRSVEVTPHAEGVYRIRGRSSESGGEGAREGPAPLEATSNPLVVRAGAPRVVWADLHGHSNLSDGTGTPEDYFDYARRVSALDVVALTDHDHWGMQFLDTHPELWSRIAEATRAAHDPGSFVTLLGFEWTSWLHGHRHVLYFSDEGEVISSIDPDTENPAQLWEALSGKPALTFAHHSAGGPISTNWRYPPDPILEPVTEIVSVHGSSEAEDSPVPIYSPQRGNFVRDVLDRGYRFGFIGSGDSHDGHPGLARLANPAASAGLAAIFSETLDRQGVLAALRARNVYATDGTRIWLSVRIDGGPMGRTLSASDVAREAHLLEVEVAGTAPIERVDLVRGGGGFEARIDSRPGGDRLDWRERIEVTPLRSGEYLYVRVVQRDRRAAWSSPVYMDAPQPGEGGGRSPVSAEGGAR